MLHGVLATVVNLASTTFILMWNMTFTVACHVFSGKLFGNPRFFGREIGNWRSKKKAKLFWTSTQVLRHLLALKKSLSFALASPGKTFIFMQNYLNFRVRANGRNISGSCCLRLHVAKSLNGFKLFAATPSKTQQHVTGCKWTNARNM